MCRLNAKPLRSVDAWLRDYETLWGDSLRGLKKYIEGAHQKEKNR